MRTDRPKKEYLPFAFGALLWGITLLWVNFHGAQWYNFDMYADASFARLAAEQNTLFPQDWIFGNQYYVIATPAVASLFFRVCHESVFAMACAASLMFCLILACYVWCCRPLFSRRALWAGLFCMAGGSILGDSISSSTCGFQILYTMAAYYACYLLVILLHLGIWIRLRKKQKVSPIFPVLALTGSAALGVQSPRETLSLCIPLLLVTLVLWLRSRTDAGEKRSLIFATASLAVNLAGLYLNGFIREHGGTRVLSNVSAAGSGTVPQSAAEQIRGSLNAFLDLVGLRYLSYGWKWKPLAVLGLLLLVTALAALVVSLKKKNFFDRQAPDPPMPDAGSPRQAGAGRQKADTPASEVGPLLLFCWISLLGVFAAGVLFVQVRAIYYFVWYLLVPLSVSALCDFLPVKGRAFLCAGVILCGAVNYFYNVYPDLSKYRGQKQFYAEIVSRLEEQGVKTVYGDYQAPTIAACAAGRIAYGSVFPNAAAEAADADGKSGLLIPYGSPVSTEAYRSVDPESAVLILSDSPYDEMSGYRYLTGYLSEAYRERFEEFFHQEECFESPHISYYVYSFSDPELFGEEYAG